MNQIQKSQIGKHPNLNRFGEYEKYSQVLQSTTLFPYSNIMAKGTFFRAILNFSFREVDFNKKRVLPFFFAMELLTNQKCVATLSTKNVLAWKLRKGMLTGCKVTLREKNLSEFFDSLLLALPRMEKFQPVRSSLVEKNKTNSFSLRLGELVLFYPVELGLGINAEVRKIEINFLFKTFTKEEKIFLLTSSKIPLMNEIAKNTNLR